MTSRAVVLALAAAAAAAPGCVERELRIESEPPGADVWIDGRHAGKTPLREPFTFYGNRGLELRHDGCTPVRQTMPVNAPWYQIIPLDFFFEHLWPGTLSDVHEVKITLEPAREEDPLSLIEKAKRWRAEAEKTPAK